MRAREARKGREHARGASQGFEGVRGADAGDEALVVLVGESVGRGG